MTTDPNYRLLASDEPDPVQVFRAGGSSPFVLTCEHAGRTLPRRSGVLGLDSADLERHITYDIGALGIAQGLSERLDAVLVAQTYSRLVVDCNRAPHAGDFIATISETTRIPGNFDVSARERSARASEIFHPYHDRIAAVLAARAAQGRQPVLVSVHTCTPVYHGVRRPWHVGVLHDHDRAFAQALLRRLGEGGDLTVGDNEPYALTEDRDYTLPVHGHRRGIHHVAFEIRQDLVATQTGQQAWAERLTSVLPRALEEIGFEERTG